MYEKIVVSQRKQDIFSPAGSGRVQIFASGNTVRYSERIVWLSEARGTLRSEKTLGKKNDNLSNFLSFGKVILLLFNFLKKKEDILWKCKSLSTILFMKILKLFKFSSLIFPKYLPYCHYTVEQACEGNEESWKTRSFCNNNFEALFLYWIQNRRVVASSKKNLEIYDHATLNKPDVWSWKLSRVGPA